MASKAGKTLVFVYGTLKRGQPNHQLLTDTSNGAAVLMTTAVTSVAFPLVIASRYNIPFLLDAPAKGKHVEGEVYEVDDLMLGKLDELEAHPKFYRRRLESMNRLEDKSIRNSSSNDKVDGDNSSITAYVYLLPNFKPAMLSLPMLTSYDTNGDHGLAYVPRYSREKDNISLWSEVTQPPSE